MQKRERERRSPLHDLLRLLVQAGTVELVHTQPPTVACKMEAQSEHAHIAYTGFFFARSAPTLHAQSVLTNKISASELSRKFIKGLLLAGRC